MRAAVFILPLAGCTSSTAVIAQEANVVRARAASATRHLDAAQADLEAIETAAAQVHEHVAYVSDDEHPIFGTLQFISVAVVAAAILGAIYYLKGRK